MQNNTAQNNTAQNNTAQNNTAQNNTAPYIPELDISERWNLSHTFHRETEFVEPTNPILSLVPDLKTQNANKLAPVLFLGLLSLQLLDFAFTYLGVRIFGSPIEANPLIREQMNNFGPFWGLALIKLAAIFLLYFLWTQRLRISWILPSVGALSVAYLFLAVLPWAFILGVG